MDLVYQRDSITAAELEEALPGRPSNSTVRTLLRILEERGHLSHREDQGRYVYSATTPRLQAARSALTDVVKTFFQGSVEQAFATLISTGDRRLGNADLERLSRLIEEVKSKAQPKEEDARD